MQQDGAQAGVHASEMPGNAALQPQPQLGSPQGAPGQPMKLSEAMLSQLHYHPPVGEISSIRMCLMSGRSINMWRCPQQLQHCQLACLGQVRRKIDITSGTLPWYCVSRGNVWPFWQVNDR